MTTVSEIFETMAYGPAPESDKPALEWIARHEAGEFGLFIGGRWTDGAGGEGEGGRLDVVNPGTTARLARVTQAGQVSTGLAGLLYVDLHERCQILF